MAEAIANVPSAPHPFAAVIEIENTDGSSRISEGKNEGMESQKSEVVKPWHAYIVEQAQELKQTVAASTNSMLG